MKAGDVGQRYLMRIVKSWEKPQNVPEMDPIQGCSVLVLNVLKYAPKLFLKLSSFS